MKLAPWFPKDLPLRPVLSLSLAIAGATIALALIAANARRTFRTLQDASQRRQEAYEFLMALRQLRQHVGEARVGAAGYVLSRDSVYRATYERGIAGFGADTIALRSLGRGRPTLERTLARLGPALASYDSSLAAAVRNAERRSLAEMSSELRGSRDVVLLEGIRGTFLALEQEQMRLLDAGAREVAAAVRRSSAIITLATAFGVLILVVAGSAVVRQLQARERAARALREQEQQLRESEKRFLQAQKMEAVGRLAGGIAHDFNNLLTVIIGRAELATLEPVPGRTALALREIEDAARRAAALTRQLLAFSRQELIEPVVFAPNHAVSEMGRMLQRLIGEDLVVALKLAPDAGSVRMDRGQFEQLIMNLVVNARDAMPLGGQVTLETTAVTLADEYVRGRSGVEVGDYVMLAVSDTGTGMTDEVKARVFEPFFSTKERGKGTGLGLSTCFGIVKQAGGHIAVYSELGLGTSVKVFLPRVPETPATPVRRGPVALPGGQESILLVEDDAAVRRTTADLLKALGYRVVEAGDAPAALRILESPGTTIDLLLTDVVLPGAGGRELADQVRARWPAVAVLFASGYTDDVVFRHRLLERNVALLPKPFSREALAIKVREVLDTGKADNR